MCLEATMSNPACSHFRLTQMEKNKTSKQKAQGGLEIRKSPTQGHS